MLTPERIKELSDRHLRIVGAGYVRPQDAEEFARAIESEVRRLHAENADRAARAPADSVLEDAARLEQIAEAIRDYHHALDMRQHGGVAQDRAVNAICNAMGMHWTQGAEAARRAPAAQRGGA